MKPVRLHGDPFGSGHASVALRAVLQLCPRRGFAASLCLSSVRPSARSAAATVALGDGVRTFPVATDLPPEAIAALQRAAATPVPATAPVVVFAPRRFCSEALALAGLEWPRACAVLAGDADSAAAVLDRVEAELRWAGTEDPEIACDQEQLAPWAALPPPPGDGAVLHVGAADPAAGSDVAVRAFLRACPDGERRLRVVLPPDAAVAAAYLASVAVATGGTRALERIEFVTAPLQPAHALDCAAILQPLRRLFAGDVLAQLLASGRPVVATRFHATAPALGVPGTCVPVGGLLVTGADGLPWCEPDVDNVVAGLQQALADGPNAAAMGRRARTHAVADLSADRPSAPSRPPSAPAGRPVVALEAPLFEVSSAAELSIETARALRRRGVVDLRLVPTVPFRGDLDDLRARAPELAGSLVRDAGDVDLWLASGWPPRSQRPPRCRTFALRLDWEYGALPTELTPLVSQEADVVIVHSRHVECTVAAAGCPPSRIRVLPHGVDADLFHERAPADAELLQWKGALPAVLFVGGLVFRKGFDVLLRMALDAARGGARFVLVVKAVGQDQHYAGFHLGELARRFAATPGAPPLRLVDGNLPRSQLPALYRACDLLCHPYRGEGFGLPVLEARACGLPVLVTRGGATDDFAAGDGVVALPASRRAVELRGAYQGLPWVLEPDVDKAGELLAQSLARLPVLGAAARGAAASVRAEHTWDRAAVAIEQLAAAARAGTKASVSPEPTPVLL